MCASYFPTRQEQIPGYWLSFCLHGAMVTLEEWEHWPVNNWRGVCSTMDLPASCKCPVMCLHRLFLGIRKWQQRAWCYLCSMVNIYICPTAWACCSLFFPFFFLVFSVTCTQIIEEEGGQRGGEATRKHYPTAYYFLNPSSTDQCLYYKTWETKQMLDANLGSARWNSRHEVSESTRCELLIDLNKQTSTVAKNKQTNR